MQQKYIFLEHTADIKFKAFGKTLDEAFENVVLAIADFQTKGEKVKPKKGKKIEIHGHDKESLLYNFIEELITLLETEKFITAKANITLVGNNLKAELFGDDASNYKEIDSIKSPTYSEMQIKENKDKLWEIQVVLDV